MVFKRIIEGNKWLSANTKKMALLKLQYFKFNIGSKYLPDIWWLSVFPGLAILVIVLGFNLLGDGLKDLFDVEI